MLRKKTPSIAKVSSAKDAVTAPLRRNVQTPQVAAPHQVDLPLVANEMENVAVPPDAGISGISASSQGANRDAG